MHIIRRFAVSVMATILCLATITPMAISEAIAAEPALHWRLHESGAESWPEGEGWHEFADEGTDEDADVADAIAILLEAGDEDGVRYAVRDESGDWSDAIESGDATVDDAITGLTVTLTGSLAQTHRVRYRAVTDDGEELEWAYDGERLVAQATDHDDYPALVGIEVDLEEGASDGEVALTAQSDDVSSIESSSSLSDDEDVPPLSAQASYSWKRLGGDNRYATMNLIVANSFASSSLAVVTTGENFPDALTAAGLAGVLKCPIILTPSAYLGNEARVFLNDLGVEGVYILGGTSSVSEDAEAQIQQLGISTRRVAGSNRYSTAVAAMRVIRERGSESQSVIIADGTNYPDALSIGPWSFATATPIILADGDGLLSEEAITAINQDDWVNSIVICGGENSVSDEIMDPLSGYYNYSYDRLAGSNRYDTSRRIAEWESNQGFNWAHPSVTTGMKFPDALAASALNGTKRSPILLYDSADSPSCAPLWNNRDAVQTGYLLGGTSSVASDDPIADYAPYAPAPSSPVGNTHFDGHLNGVDISGWDRGINIDYLDAEFVIIKATEGLQGTIYNPDYHDWADKALANDKLLGFYHYANGDDPVEEADEFYEAIKDYRGRAIACLDWEGQGNDLFDTGKDVEWCKKFLDRLQSRFGGTPMIYMSKNVTTKYNWSPVAAAYPLWGAQYADNEDVKGYQLNPWQSSGKWGAWGSKPTIFQYTSCGVLERNGGNKKLFDFDLFYGTKDAWLAYLI